MDTIFLGSRWSGRVRVMLSLASMLGAHYAYAAPLAVTARINPGTACTANLSNADLAYGEIRTNELSKDKPSVLDAKSITLNVACAPLASKFFFSVLDRNRNHLSAPENLGAAVGVPDDEWAGGMGLGHTPDDRAIGELFLKSTAMLADQRGQILLHSNGGGGSSLSFDWEKPSSPFIFGDATGIRRYAVADAVNQTITAAKNFSLKIDAIPVISPSAIDDLSVDTRIDSKFTIEVTQL